MKGDLAMLSRRGIALILASAPALSACGSGGTVDPAAVAAQLKSLCGLVINVGTILTVINAAAGQTLEGVVNLICSSFKASVAQSVRLGGPLLAVGSEHQFVVSVKGESILVTATIVEIK
jgi:hypothetical protein